MLPTILITIAAALIVLPVLNFFSYRVVGAIIRNCRKKWDLHICCGRTDGGGVNVDIVNHADAPNRVVVDDVCSLPFQNGASEATLCSHTIEHVEDPAAFCDELRRVSNHVTLVVPPLGDLCAVLNVFEHRHLFFSPSFSLSARSITDLPRFIELPGAQFFQERLGQKIRAWLTSSLAFLPSAL